MSPEKSIRKGKVYRTSDFASVSSNPTRYVGGLVGDGVLCRLQGGRFYAPKVTRWGAIPPTAESVLSAWLQGKQGKDWVYSGSIKWNTLGLGATAVHAEQWVYNRQRSGSIELAGHHFLMRKIPFPRNPTLEWYVVDLLNHAQFAAQSFDVLVDQLADALVVGEFDHHVLIQRATQYGRKATRAGIAAAIHEAGL